MLIMVANKKKLKRIIIGVVVALLAIGGIIFGVVKIILHLHLTLLMRQVYPMKEEQRLIVATLQ